MYQIYQLKIKTINIYLFVLMCIVEKVMQYQWKKNTLNVIEAFKNFLLLCKPKKITCDNGSEFISKNFVNICKQNNIDIDYVNVNNHLISHVGNRLGIVDRWIQTFRPKMEKYMTEHNTNIYINVLKDLVENMIHHLIVVLCVLQMMQIKTKIKWILNK